MFFALTGAPIDLATCRDQLQHPHAGGYVSFEGWVRNHHEGRSVASLAYEAYPELSAHEAEAILSEAMARFKVVDVACVHRTGELAIGDCAVWVGVSAAHRQAAFDACRYVIDAIKHRVPIWKHETYSDGTQAWVNCHACAQVISSSTVHGDSDHPHQVPHLSQLNRYARQMALPEVGRVGQAQLERSRVLVVGAGGLGAAALSYLAAAGVGTLGICDADTLDVTNLHRQVLYRDADIGQPKAALAKAALLALNPTCRIHTYPYALTPENAAEMLAPYDVIVDGTDTVASKIALSDAAVALQKLVVFASVHQYEGQLWCYLPGQHAPCVRCLWPYGFDTDRQTRSCQQAGVLGVTPGVLGVLQATQVLKYLLGLSGDLMDNSLLLVDLLTLSTTPVVRVQRPDCLCAKPSLAIRRSDKTRQQAKPDETSTPLKPTRCVLSLQDILPMAASCQWIDIRPDDEDGYKLRPLPVHAIRLASAHDVMAWLQSQPPKRPTILICQHGVISISMARSLQRHGYPNVYALTEGASALLENAAWFATTMS